jgi:glucose-6-phosphate 1-dehydrogenase
MIDRLKIEENAAKPAPSCTLVIFGITGDLVHRLLMPALYNLARWKRLPADFGVGRSEISVGSAGPREAEGLLARDRPSLAIDLNLNGIRDVP